MDFDMNIKERWRDLLEYAKEEKRLDDETGNRICLASFIINEFGESYKMDKQKGYFYLKKYGGIDYLNEHWKTLFTEMDNPRNVIRKFFDLCEKNGGNLELFIAENNDAEN